MALFSVDLLIEIIKNLPIKSLIRFRCVSRSWYNLISYNFYFSKLQFLHQKTLNPSDCYLIVRRHKNSKFPHFYLCLNNRIEHPIERVIRFDDQSNTSFFMVGSANGLICLCNNSIIVLWNPLTNTNNRLPCPLILSQFDKKSIEISYAFAVDSELDFKIISIVSDKSLSSVCNLYTVGTPTWRRVPCRSYHFPPTVSHLGHHGSVNYPPTIDDEIYWVGFEENTQCIIAFHITFETFRTLPLPTIENPNQLSVGKLNNSLCIFNIDRYRGFEIWEIVDGMWIKTSTILKKMIGGATTYAMNPIDGASNSEIVIKQCDRAYYLFSPRTSSMQKLPKLPFETSNAYSITLSLFSPKQVGREKRKRRRILLEKLGGVEGETVNCKKARCGLSTSDILISGMQRLGVEIAKNLVLAGVKSVTLHDESPVQLWDLSSSLAFSENDVGKNRTLASVQKLQELNTAVAVSTLTTTLTKEQLSDFQAVVFTDISLEKAIEFDNYCRAQQPPIVFIKTEVRGLFGSVFCDFGPEYTVADIDGQEPHSGKIASISNDNPTLVSCDDDERLDFQDGDLVVLSEVKGMAELNDGRSRKVKKASWPHSFQLDEDTSNYGSYERGGIVTQVKQPKALHFKSLKEALSNPGDFLLSDFSKSDRPPVLHLAFQALDKFVSELGRCPAPGSEEDIQELISVADAINDEMGDHKVKIDRKIIRDLALGSRTVLSPMAAMFGGIVGQEVVQALACSGKFHRPFQFLYFNSIELMRTEPPDPDDLGPLKSGYDAVFGIKLQKILEDAKVSMLGVSRSIITDAGCQSK